MQNNALWMVLSFSLKRAENVFVSPHGIHSSGRIYKIGNSVVSELEECTVIKYGGKETLFS